MMNRVDNTMEGGAWDNWGVLIYNVVQMYWIFAHALAWEKGSHGQ